MSFLSKRMKLLILGAALVVALPLVAVSATNSWSVYHWERETTPAKFVLVDSTDSAWTDGSINYLAVAAADWNASDVLTVSVDGSKSQTKRKCNAAEGTIRVCSGTYGFNGWLGMASIKVSGGHIISANTRLNDSYFNTSTYDTPAWRQMVMCQEIGHDFGLNHQDTSFNNTNLGTCMDYTGNPEGPPSNEHPDSHDYGVLVDIYAHLDSPSTNDGGGGKPCGKGKNAKPCPKAATFGIGTALQHGIPVGVGPADGDVFFTDLGKGVTLVTFVTWVD